MGDVALSVVIITRDAPRALANVLDGMAAQAGGADAEIVVVDDGSSPPLDALSRRTLPRLRTIRIPEGKGRAAARNRGADAATGTRLLFLDGDMVPGVGLLAAHARYGSNSIVVMGYRHDLHEPSPDGITQGLFSPDRRERLLQRYGEDVSHWLMPWQIGYTHNISVARQDFERVGGFDEAFRSWGCEDDEFSYRLHHAGARFVFDRAAVAFHLPHERDRSGENASNMNNSAAIVAKHRTVDVELLHHLRQTRYVETQSMLQALLDVASRAVISEALERAADLAEAPCLVLGARPDSLSTSRAVMSHPSLMRGTSRESLLGVALPYADGEFATVILGGLCSSLPELAQAVVSEAGRVGRTVITEPVRQS